MSDYISKSALKEYMRDYKWDFAMGSDFSKAIEMVDVQPTISETEIIRKAFDRVVERLEAKSQKWADVYNLDFEKGHINEYADLLREGIGKAIEIVKEECGIDG